MSNQKEHVNTQIYFRGPGCISHDPLADLYAALSHGFSF